MNSAGICASGRNCRSSAAKARRIFITSRTFLPAPPGQPSRGATHTADLAYMFDNPPPNVTWTDVDKQLADTMSSYWVNFAATGNPNGKGLPEWPAYKAKTGEKNMVLGDTVAGGFGHRSGHAGFLRLLLCKIEFRWIIKCTL